MFKQSEELKQTSDYEVNSTLFGGVCKLMVTGGPNPVLGEAIKETGGGEQTDALAPGVGNEALSAERVGQLLVETFTNTKQYPQTFHRPHGAPRVLGCILRDVVQAPGRGLGGCEFQRFGGVRGVPLGHARMLGRRPWTGKPVGSSRRALQEGVGVRPRLRRHARRKAPVLG